MTHAQITAPDAGPHPSPQERRRDTRVELVTAVNVFSDSNFYAGFTSDISEGGIFVSTYVLQPVGAEVDVSLGLPGGHEINARGVVRWVRDPHDLEGSEPPGMGIEFGQLDERARDLISEFVAQVREPSFHP